MFNSLFFVTANNLDPIVVRSLIPLEKSMKLSMLIFPLVEVIVRRALFVPNHILSSFSMMQLIYFSEIES